VSLLLYAIAEEGAETARTSRGVEAAPVRVIAAAGLRALVSEHAARPTPTEHDLWAFEDVVAAEMDSGAVLPARFGSMVADREALERLLHARRGRLREQLERVRGAVELGVRAMCPGGSGEAGSTLGMSGLAYMRGRVAENERARELARRLEDELAPLARAARLRVLPRHRVLLSGAYLVDRDRMTAFAARAAALEDELPDAELLCTGPWPPYSFVEGGDG
jgi:hypothetical protein